MAAFKGLVLCLALAVTWGAELQAGLIKPKTSKPISLSFNNKAYISDYTFKFQIQTSTPATSVLKITFPSDSYESGLGISTAPTCTAQDEKANAYSSCSVSGRVVTVSFAEVSNSPVDNTYTVTIKNVKNPISEGGTGFFSLQTWKGINLIDDNEYFGRVGIYSASQSPNEAFISCASTCLANKASQYNFSYRPSQEIPADARIKLTFPSELSLPSPPDCSSEQIPNVVCSRVGQVVTISGLTSSLKTTSSITVKFLNVVNPGYSGSISNYSFMVLQAAANNILDVNTSISAATVSASTLSVTVCPNTTACSASDPLVSISNKMYYTVSVTTNTDIPANGKIVVSIPNTYTLVTGTCLVLSGLTHYAQTETDMLTCTVDPAAFTVTITKFGAFASGTFSFKFQATNPNSSGVKGTVSATTYYDSAGTKSIDTGSSNSISVANLATMTSWVWNWSWIPLTPSLQATIAISFISPSSFAFTASSISLKFPTAFSFNGTPSATCTAFGVTPDPALSASYSTSTGVLGLTSADSFTFTSTTLHTLDITSSGGGMVMPSSAGTYEVEVQFNDGTNIVHSFLHEVVITAASMTGTAKAYSNNVEQKTVYELTFTPTISVPTSSIPSNISSTWGQLNIRFPTATNYWQLDLGTGKATGDTVTCKGITNITAVSSNLTCKLTLGAARGTTDYAYVSVTGFNALPSGTAVTLHLAGLQHVDTGGLSPTVTVEAVSNTQRILVQSNLATYTLPKTSYDDNSVSVPITNGRSPSPDGDGKNVLTLTPNTVSLSTEVSFIAWPEYDLAISSAFIMKFPTYYPVPTSVTCFVDYTTSVTCYSYPDSNWILVVLSAQMTKHVEYTVTLKGFTNPKDQIDLGALNIVAINANAYESEYIKFKDFSLLGTGAISPVSLTPSSYQANAVDVTYTWIFTLTNNIELGGSIVLSFPKDNYVTTTTPTLECEISGTLYAKSTTNPIACAFSSNTVSITNFAAHTAGATISVKVKHVLNPTEPTTTGYFYIETFSARGYLQDTNYTISPIVIYDKVKVGKLTHTQFVGSPSNGKAYADWTVLFTPSVSYPKETYIYVTLPASEFTSISTSPTCYIAGGLTTLKSCSSDGANIVTLITDADYAKTAASTPIEVTITNLKSFTGGLTSGVVTVTAKYSDVTIDSSPDSEVNRKFTTDLEYKDLFFPSFYYSPLTAAEPASYNFTIEPQTSFASNCTLNIRFPNIYPRRLGDYVNCTSAELSAGSMTCYVKSRTVVISGLKAWTAASGKSFNVTVDGVNNPNSGTSISSFIAYTQCGSKVYDYLDKEVSSTNFITLPSRMWMWNATTTSAYSLYSASVTFKANTTTPIKGSNTDMLYVDFPSSYDFTFVKKLLSCDSLILNTTQSDPCSLTNNRFAVSAYSSSVDASTNPVVGITINNLENPGSAGEVEYARLSVLNSETRQIIGSTYPNLAQIASLAYESAGLTLTVNYDQTITLNRGTRSKLIYAIIETASPTRAVLKPRTVPDGVSLTKDSMTYYIGDTTNSFQVSASQDATLGTSYIEWTLSSPDTSLTLFSPVKRTKLVITDDKSETVTVSEVTYIPRGGSTLPLSVKLSNPVDSELILKFVKIGKLPTKLALNPEVLTFEAGEQEKTYVLSIAADSTGDSGEFIVYKSGANSASYSLVKSTFKFTVTQPDGSKPIVKEARLINTDFTYAKFRIILNEASRVYWAVGVHGTSLPSFEDLKAADSDGKNKFDALTYGNSVDYQTKSYQKLEYSIEVDDLVAQTNYVFFGYVQDLGGNIAEQPIQIEFSTNALFNPAYVILKFLQDPLGDDFKVKILQDISEICKLDVGLFEFMDYDTEIALSEPLDQGEGEDDSVPISTTTSYSGRSSQGISLAKIVIFPDPNSSSQVPPLAYGDLLASETVEISRRLQTFDPIYPIKGIEIINKSPVFLTNPEFVKVSSDSVEVANLSIDQLGYIYFCAIKSDEQPATPLAWNVIRGLDASNMPCNVYDSTKITTEVSTYDVVGFEPLSKYWLYMSATNQIQRHPADGEEVVVLGFQTEEDDDSSGVVLLVSASLGLVLN
jgi:hypothetical protein